MPPKRNSDSAQFEIHGAAYHGACREPRGWCGACGSRWRECGGAARIAHAPQETLRRCFVFMISCLSMGCFPCLSLSPIPSSIFQSYSLPVFQPRDFSIALTMGNGCLVAILGENSMI